MSTFKRKSILIISALVVFLLILCAAGFGVWRYKKYQLNAPYELARQSQEFLDSGEYSRARACMEEALTFQPDNKEFLWNMAVISKEMNKISDTQAYAMRAWQLGKCEKEVFYALIAACGLDEIDARVKYGEELLKDIVDEQSGKELRGDLYVMQGLHEEAIAYYQKLYAQFPTPGVASKIASELVSLKKAPDALAFLQQVMNDNGLDEKGYIALCRLSIFDNPQSSLDSIIEHAQAQGEYNQELQYQYGVLRNILGDPSKADNIFSDILSGGLVLEPSREREIRLLLGLNAFTRKDSKALSELLSSVTGDDAAIEGERKLYQILIEAVDGAPLNQVVSEFELVSRLIPGELVVNVLKARFDTASGKPLKALEFYGSIQDPLYKLWPEIVVNSTVALMKSGEPRKALQYIASYHKTRGAFTVQTALLQRNLLAELNEKEQAEKVQEVVEKAKPENVNLKLQGGLLAIHNGDVDKGIGVLKKLEEQNRGNSQVRWTYAATLLRMGKAKEAIEFLDTVELDGRLLALKAEALTVDGNMGEAKQVYLDGIKRFQTEELYRSYCNYLIRQNYPEEANEFLTESARLYPDSTWPLRSLAVYKFRNGDIASARALAEKAQVIDSESLEIASLLSEVYMNLKLFDEAVELCDKVISGQEKTDRAKAIKGMCLVGVKQFDKALVLLEQCVMAFPQSLKLSMSYVQCLLALKKPEQALSQTRMLYEKFPKVAVVVNSHVTALRYTNNIDDALEIVEKSVSILSQKDYALQKSSLLVQQGQPDAAIKTLQAGGDDISVSRALLYLELKYGDFDKALTKSDKVQLSVSNWRRLANDAQRNSNFTRASICYKKALELDGKHPVILNNYAWSAWKATGRVNDELLESSRKAATLLSDNVAVLDTYAQLLLEAKKYDTCIAHLRLQASNSRADSRLLYWLGVAYEKSGKSAKAVKVYQTALKKQKLKGAWIIDINESELKSKIDYLTN